MPPLSFYPPAVRRTAAMYIVVLNGVDLSLFKGIKVIFSA